jgi:hypothetical protein
LISVNCRKACKKCHEQRPCPRCIRYSIDCYDAVKKDKSKVQAKKKQSTQFEYSTKIQQALENYSHPPENESAQFNYEFSLLKDSTEPRSPPYEDFISNTRLFSELTHGNNTDECMGLTKKHQIGTLRTLSTVCIYMLNQEKDGNSLSPSNLIFTQKRLDKLNSSCPIQYLLN